MARRKIARLQIDFDSGLALLRWVRKANELRVLEPPAVVQEADALDVRPKSKRIKVYKLGRSC